MCLAVLALRPSSIQVPCAWNWVVVANRDEAHDRPTVDIRPWDDVPGLLAGRDLRAGGAWLGVHNDGRFALLTNYREPAFKRDDAPSRGALVERYLKQSLAPQHYLNALNEHAADFNGFNLLLGQPKQWWHASNRASPFARLIADEDTQATDLNTQFDPNAIRIYGLSNALFDTPWPKVVRTRQGVLEQLAIHPTRDPWQTMQSLAAVFNDTRVEADNNLPNTGLSLERERLVSSPFIKSPSYGTRCTTVVMQTGVSELRVQETTFFPDGTQRSHSAWTSINHQPWQQYL